MYIKLSSPRLSSHACPIPRLRKKFESSSFEGEGGRKLINFERRRVTWTPSRKMLAFCKVVFLAQSPWRCTTEIGGDSFYFLLLSRTRDSMRISDSHTRAISLIVGRNLYKVLYIRRISSEIIEAWKISIIRLMHKNIEIYLLRAIEIWMKWNGG